MRLTINLDDDLYAMARAHAVANKLSMSKAVGDLLRKYVSGSDSIPPSSDFHIDPVTQLPVVKGRGPITDEDIQAALDDEDRRYLEIAGVVPEGERS